MSWLKKSDDFAVDCVDLSDAAYRTHDEALLYVMQHETGGRFRKRALYWFAGTADPESAAAELVAAGFWKDHGSEFEVVHHIEHQPEPDVLASRRARNAARVRKHRRKKAGLDSEPDVTALRNASVTRYRGSVTPVGSGRGGTGATTEEKKNREIT